MPDETNPERAAQKPKDTPTNVSEPDNNPKPSQPTPREGQQAERGAAGREEPEEELKE